MKIVKIIIQSWKLDLVCFQDSKVDDMFTEKFGCGYF